MQDITFFLKDYLNVITHILLFLFGCIVSIHYFKDLKIHKLIVSIGLITISLELLLTFFFKNIQELLLLITQKEIVNAYLVDLERGRSWFILHTEIFFPIFAFFILFSRKIQSKILYSIYLLATVYLSVFSNVRTRGIQLATAIVLTSIFLLIRNKAFATSKKLVIFLAIGIIGTIIVGLNISSNEYNFSIIDRFANESSVGDEQTIISRLSFYHKAYMMFLSSPFIGLGLGNYLNTDVIINNPNLYFGSNNYKSSYAQEVAYSPHNIFFELLSETGILGLITFLLLCIYFLYTDYSFTLKGNKPLWPFAVSSWVIFTYTLFNPYNTLYIFGWFWFLRGIIEGQRKLAVNIR
jgi:O-antigen ligase